MDAAKRTPGVVVIDAKSIYDTIAAKNHPANLCEKRTALELLAYLENTTLNGAETRRVHGEANLADNLTKVGAEEIMRRFLTDCRWSIVKDDRNLSARKRREMGLDKMANTEGLNNFNALLLSWFLEVWPELSTPLEEEWRAPFPNNL